MDKVQFTVGLFNFLFVINILLAIVVVFFERRNPTSTLTWLVVLLFLPGLGFILYLFLGQDLKRKRLFKLKKEEEKRLYSIISEQKNFLENYREYIENKEIAEYLDVIHLNLYSDNAFYTENNKIDVLDSGNKKFELMKAALKNAEKFIHMEYYIIQNDVLGREIVEILTKKAKEGVEVKLLYDGMGCIRLPKKFFNSLIEAGGKVACFFPPFVPYINLRLNYRNHRKICIIDGQSGFIGGFNIGDEYLGLSKRFGFWRDTHLCIEGDAIDGLELRFLLDWRYASNENALFNEGYFPKRSYKGQRGVQIVSSGPDSKWTSIKNGYIKLMNKAQKRIYIETPYLIPDDGILDALKIASLSGVDVRIIVPAKPDHPIVHWASLSYIGELLEVGVKCYTYNKGFVHSKYVLVDGKVSSIGTANLDVRSFKLNFEVNAFIYCSDTCAKLEEAFLEDLNHCNEITLDEYNNRKLMVKIKEGISRLLSPIL